MNWLGYLDYPQGKGSLLFVVLHCSSSKPVYGRLTSEQSPVLQIRPRLWLWLCLCCIFSLCSHRPFFSRRQSPSTTTMVSLSLTSLTPPMPSPSSSPSFHHSTMQLQPSESGEHRAARVLGIANSPMHSSIHVSLHGLTNIKPLHPHPHNRALSNSFRAQCLLATKITNSRGIARSKHAVPRLFDRLARDAMQPARIKGYIKIATMLGDVQCSQCSHSLEGRHPHWQYYNNQLGWSLSPSLPFIIPSLSHAQHPSSLVPYCLHLPHGGLHI